MTTTQTKFLSATAALLFMGTGAAGAHTTFEIDEAVVGRSFKAVLQVPHGCDGKATTEVQVKLPEGFVFAKPQPKAGWDLEIIKGDYAQSYKNHGETVTSGALEIRWKNGNLPDDWYDTFVIVGTMSGFTTDTTLAFPVTQLCGTDTKVVWDEIPAAGQSEHDLQHPAPTIDVVMAEEAGHDQAGSDHAGHDDDDMADMAGMAAVTPAEVTVGSLQLSAGAAKAMLPGAKVGGGGLVIANAGSADDRLSSVKSAAAGRVELHQMAMVDDVMSMREVKDGIVIPAGKTVELTAGGGFHLMFMDVTTPFAEGASVPVTLTFEKAGPVDYVLPIGNAAGGPAHSHN